VWDPNEKCGVLYFPSLFYFLVENFNISTNNVILVWKLPKVLGMIYLGHGLHVGPLGTNFHVLKSIYEGRLFVLFCLYQWDPPNQDASDLIFGLFGKLSRRRGAWAWFHGIWTCNAKVLEYWMISSLKIKLN
jgi:hypothetical protein